MDKDDPIDIQYTADEDNGKRELHISFKPTFQTLDLDRRIDVFQSYIDRLKAEVNSTEDFGYRQGVITIGQICETLLHHIKSDEIPLSETLIVEMGEQQEGTSLDELLNRTKLN